jgi:hypothetical protein
MADAAVQGSTLTAMWVPRDAEEVEEVVRRGGLEETPSFDGKLKLPTPKRNIDLAIDVAAMSTEGGVLLYGVGEDDEERLTDLAPFSLDGEADRIAQVVATSIAEVPYIEVRELPCAEDATKGYVSVLVPQSARAPHQVIVKNDKRYYGRAAKGNRRLGEAEVARLYQRRLTWEQDGYALLAGAVAEARFPPHPDLAFLHGFARPVSPDRHIWERAEAAAGGRRELQEELRTATDGAAVRNRLSSRSAANWRRQGADEWLLSTQPDVDPSQSPDSAEQAIDMRVNVDGRGHLFFGRAGARANGGMIVLQEPAIAGTVASFFALMGRLYELGGYHGQVDIGVSVTNLRDAVSSQGSPSWTASFEREAFRAESYPRASRVTAAELLDPRGVAGALLGGLFEATGGRSDYDPFAA